MRLERRPWLSPQARWSLPPETGKAKPEVSVGEKGRAGEEGGGLSEGEGLESQIEGFLIEVGMGRGYLFCYLFQSREDNFRPL